MPKSYSDKEWKNAGILVENRPSGLRITQSGRSYFARKWQLTELMINTIDRAAKAGLPAIWRHSHPKDRCFFDHGESAASSHHVMFSETHSSPWIFGLGGEAKPPIGTHYTFNHRTKAMLDAEALDSRYQVVGGKDIRVAIADGEIALSAVMAQGGVAGRAAIQHRRQPVSRLFTNELSLQDALHREIFCPGAVEREVRFPSSLEGSVADIPDFIARHSSPAIIIEIKPKFVTMRAFAQLERYLMNEALKEILGLDVIGVYIALEFQTEVKRTALESYNIHLYEYKDSDRLLLLPLGEHILKNIVNSWLLELNSDIGTARFRADPRSRDRPVGARR